MTLGSIALISEAMAMGNLKLMFPSNRTGCTSFPRLPRRRGICTGHGKHRWPVKCYLRSGSGIWAKHMQLERRECRLVFPLVQGINTSCARQTVVPD